MVISPYTVLFSAISVTHSQPQSENIRGINSIHIHIIFIVVHGHDFSNLLLAIDANLLPCLTYKLIGIMYACRGKKPSIYIVQCHL